MDPNVTVGPLAISRQKDKLLKQIRKSIDRDGGSLAYGNLDYEHSDPLLKNGNFVEPMVVEGINTDSKSWHEEFFGPVFNLYKASSQKHALDLANKSDFGLSSAVFTENEEKLLHASERLRTGTVFLNDISTTAPDFPSGGIKGSGFGRECFSDGLHEISNRKVIIRP
jgi:succinate-semialdehyde dehydrogenase/glutarate-semialdehyde dehydrogenase